MGVFHRNENWLLTEFGKAEGQGIKYVKSELSFIKKKGKLYLLPEFVLRIFAKYFGYKLGRNYTLFPKNLKKKMSLNRTWWEKGH